MSPKRESAAVPVPQRLILGCVLAFTGGFLDIYTYLIRGGVFANAQTSNLIFLGLRLMEGDWPQALNYFAQVASYVVGILVAGVVKRRIGTKGNLHWRQIVIFAEFILVTIIGYIPTSFPPEPVNVIVAFICSVQVASFDSLEGTSLPPPCVPATCARWASTFSPLWWISGPARCAACSNTWPSSYPS